MLAYQLVAKHQVGDLKVGDHVTDPVLVEKYSRTHAAFFVRKLVEAEPSTSSPQPTSSQSQAAPKLTPIV